MRSILVTNHKGGVGKTFTSVHLASYWAKIDQRRVLVVDCDGQYDSYNFLVKDKEIDSECRLVKLDDDFHVIPNHTCKSLKKIGVGEETYDYVIIDSDARLVETAITILQNPKLDMVLAPIRGSLSVTNLKDLMKTVTSLYGLREKAGNQARRDKKIARDIIANRMMLLPLGSDLNFLRRKLLEWRIRTRINVNNNMRYLPKETDLSLQLHEVMWESESLATELREEAKNYFSTVTKKIQKFIDQKR